MSRYLAGFAALALMGAAVLPLQANAAERHGASNTVSNSSTTLSAQRHYWRYRHHYWGPRYRYYGPRYGYYGGPYYGYPYRYRYYRPGPVVGFGIGPFGFGIY